MPVTCTFNTLQAEEIPAFFGAVAKPRQKALLKWILQLLWLLIRIFGLGNDPALEPEPPSDLFPAPDEFFDSFEGV